MNRLVLIGNGFDLAHGLSTRYIDFLECYLENAFTCDGSSGHNDYLLSVNRSGKSKVEFEAFKEVCLRSNWNDRNSQHVLNTMLHNKFGVEVKSDFLRKLLSRYRENNWVEIENEYYEDLKDILKIKNIQQKQDKLIQLNSSMNCLSEALQSYLRQIKLKNVNRKYIDIFQEAIDFDHIPMLSYEDVEQLEGSEVPSHTKILNFNYTNTVHHYLPELNGKNYSVTNIHGSLYDPENPIIFGFGDELDEDYLLMEKDKTKGFFDFIKSFWYVRTDNYHDLIRFLGSNNFQVAVLGHSCGLSDRTMLNMIFDHANCKSIKIYYHKQNDKDNFIQLTEEISRHTKNKVALRAKVVPKNKCKPMPQA